MIGLKHPLFVDGGMQNWSIGCVSSISALRTGILPGDRAERQEPAITWPDSPSRPGWPTRCGYSWFLLSSEVASERFPTASAQIWS